MIYMLLPVCKTIAKIIAFIPAITSIFSIARDRQLSNPQTFKPVVYKIYEYHAILALSDFLEIVEDPKILKQIRVSI